MHTIRFNSRSITLLMDNGKCCHSKRPSDTTMALNCMKRIKPAARAAAPVKALPISGIGKGRSKAILAAADRQSQDYASSAKLPPGPHQSRPINLPVWPVRQMNALAASAYRVNPVL